MKKKTLFMGTTKIDVNKTLHEVSVVLVASGARQIASDYGERGQVTGVRFVIPVAGVDHIFALPVRVDPLLKHCRNDRQQAERVAWRQILRWVQAQMAMIDVGMVKAEEVYAPYLLQANGRTLYEALRGSQFKMIEAPK